MYIYIKACHTFFFSKIKKEKLPYFSKYMTDFNNISRRGYVCIYIYIYVTLNVHFY